MSTKMTTIDLATLDTTKACDQPFKLQLKHPISKVLVPAYVWIVGRDSTAVTEHMNDAANAQIRRAAEANRRGEDPEVKTMEKLISEAVDTLTVAIMAAEKPWEGIGYNGQEVFPFTEANVRRMLTEQKWFRDQISIGMNTLENFLPA